MFFISDTHINHAMNSQSNGNYAVMGCTSLTEISIPESVVTIGFETFVQCDSLIGVTLGCLDGWQVSKTQNMKNAENVDPSLLSSAETTAALFLGDYLDFFWQRTEQEIE